MTALAPAFEFRFLISDRAIGDDAIRLRERLRSAARPDTSVTLSHEDRLARAVAEAAAAGWDGYASAAVSQGALAYARALLSSLSSLASDADAQVDPQGEVILEWSASPKWILTIAISESGRVAYSALLGASKIRGVEMFDGSIPISISNAIARIRDHKATLSSAGGRR
jgi:hypothetical protein